MGWTDDDDDDEDALLDFAAVEDRAGGVGDDADEDEELNVREHKEHDDTDDSDGVRELPPRRRAAQRPPAAPTSAATSAATPAAAAGEGNATQSSAQIALLYLTHKIAEEVGRERGVRFSKQLLSCVRDVVAGYAQTMGRDVEHFAKHAKRTVVNVDDVLLVARRNESLTTALETFKQRERIGVKKKGKSTKKRKAAGGSEEEAEDGGEENNGKQGGRAKAPARSRAKR